jgi:hypothetical protein
MYILQKEGWVAGDLSANPHRDVQVFRVLQQHLPSRGGVKGSNMKDDGVHPIGSSKGNPSFPCMPLQGDGAYGSSVSSSQAAADSSALHKTSLEDLKWGVETATTAPTISSSKGNQYNRGEREGEGVQAQQNDSSDTQKDNERNKETFVSLMTRTGFPVSHFTEDENDDR